MHYYYYIQMRAGTELIIHKDFCTSNCRTLKSRWKLPCFFTFLSHFQTFSRSGNRYSHFKDFFINSKPRTNPVIQSIADSQYITCTKCTHCGMPYGTDGCLPIGQVFKCDERIKRWTALEFSIYIIQLLPMGSSFVTLEYDMYMKPVVIIRIISTFPHLIIWIPDETIIILRRQLIGNIKRNWSKWIFKIEFVDIQCLG